LLPFRQTSENLRLSSDKHQAALESNHRTESIIKKMHRKTQKFRHRARSRVVKYLDIFIAGHSGGVPSHIVDRTFVLRDKLAAMNKKGEELAHLHAHV
jgi:hypothetical protein